MTRPIKPIVIKTPQGGWYIISPTRKTTLSELMPEFAQKMIRQHNDFGLAVKTFGPYHWGAELVRRYKEECQKIGRRYRREEAIEKAAACMGLQPHTLHNLLKRPRRRAKRHDR
jgi:hypothetical protein